ncbi:hypothetical protein Csa_000167 [Cucumis sativus]|uniref:Uncharacterized protein n=1 Tax=Cucumis sativus TaxID=3659 RepID=A0A0A0KNU8_CUCSA|nr:hypothetical protein Csa_000167 [Cucumis sativus]
MYAKCGVIHMTSHNIECEGRWCGTPCYGRARRIKEVWDFIENMPIGLGITVYGATLGACNIHKNVESGESR